MRQDLRNHHEILMTARVSTGVDGVLEAHGNSKHGVLVKGITTATVKIQGSVHPAPAVDADWVDLGADITADGSAFYTDKPILWIRANQTAWTAGTVSVWYVSAP